MATNDTNNELVNGFGHFFTFHGIISDMVDNQPINEDRRELLDDILNDALDLLHTFSNGTDFETLHTKTMNKAKEMQK